MRNYDEMSDFEINKLVADCKGLFWHVKPNTQGDSDGWIYSKNYEKCKTESGQVAVELPDYCNNPSEAWPVIIENNIALDPKASMDWDCGSIQFTGEWSATSVDNDDGEYFRESEWHSESDFNPLRAAMIVFLKMQESKDA